MNRSDLPDEELTAEYSIPESVEPVPVVDNFRRSICCPICGEQPAVFSQAPVCSNCKSFNRFELLQIHETQVVVIRFQNLQQTGIHQEELMEKIGETIPCLRMQAPQKKLGVVINFANVEWIESPMISGLVNLMRQFRLYEARLILCELTDFVQDIFQITHLNDLFEIAPTNLAALDSF